MTVAPPPVRTAPLYLLDTNIAIHYARGKTVGRQIEADYSLLTTPYQAADLCCYPR
jgi:hypothetical protein